MSTAEPRIPPLSAEELSEELLSIIQNMVNVNRAVNARQKSRLTDLLNDQENADTYLQDLPEIILTMLRHPDLFMRQTDIGIQLLGHGCLPPELRELAILRVGWLCQAPYEWGEHVHIAREVGLDSKIIERITEGSSAAGWNEIETAVLKAAEELHSQACISDATWSVLAKYFDDKQLIELPVLIGQYQTVAYYQNSLRLRLHEGNEGLAAR